MEWCRSASRRCTGTGESGRQGGYDPATGRRRVKQLGTFRTKRAAVAHQKAVADRVGTEGETLQEWLEKVWLPSKHGQVEVATVDQYTWAVRRHIVPMLSAVRLRDVTAEVVDSWLVDLTAVGESGKPRLGPTSARLARKVLSMALEEAVQRGRLARNAVVLTQPPPRDRTYKKHGPSLEPDSRCGLRLHQPNGSSPGEAPDPSHRRSAGKCARCRLSAGRLPPEST